MAAVSAACLPVDGGYLAVEAEFLTALADPADDPALDTVVAFDRDGEMAAFGFVHLPPGDRTERRAFPWGEVHPAHRRRGVGTALMAWLDARAEERLRAAPGPAVIRVEAGEDRADRIALFERFGYSPARFFTEMARDLAVPLPVVSIPPGIEVRPWSDDLVEAARLAHNEAFADHWGSQPWTEEAWRHGFDEFFVADASSVAFEGDRPVAYLVAAAYPHDAEHRGRSEGWIERLGTVRSHRRRGVASALIARAMAVFAGRGLDAALLGVDAENQTGAVGLYRRLGFEVERRSITYLRHLDG
jgi:mycothiol synthase